MKRDPDEAEPGDIGSCCNCGHRIRHGQPYMGRIPFRGSFGGLVHQNCPPTLTLVPGSRS